MPSTEKDYGLHALLTFIAVFVVAGGYFGSLYYSSGLLPTVDGGLVERCVDPGSRHRGCGQYEPAPLNLVEMSFAAFLGWTILSGWIVAAVAWGGRGASEPNLAGRLVAPGPFRRRILALAAVALVGVDALAVMWAFVSRPEFAASELAPVALYRLGPAALAASVLVAVRKWGERTTVGRGHPSSFRTPRSLS